ncbi:unnamed protein product, partial [Prorocentrum cordatum]
MGERGRLSSHRLLAPCLLVTVAATRRLSVAKVRSPLQLPRDTPWWRLFNAKPATPREEKLKPIAAEPDAQAQPPTPPRASTPAASAAEPGAQAPARAEQPDTHGEAPAPQPSARPPS